MTLVSDLETRLQDAVKAIVPADALDGVTLSVKAAADLRFGDYQSNAAMMLAKKAKMNPRQLAEQIVEKLDSDGVCDVSIAGPGFINFTITAETYSRLAADLLNDERLGVPETGEGHTLVVDFSAPNVAKPMHVGHIRSTIIGDSLGRIGRFLGYTVKTDNHVGDWGTQFGMVIWAWKREVNEEALTADPLTELLRLYRLANDAKKADEAIADECRQELVKLQAGDEENTAIWNRCVEFSKNGLGDIYDRLDVSFDHWLGESFYNDRLAAVVESLEAAGHARDSDGAVCVFSGGELDQKKDPFKINRDGEWEDNPMIVRKRDGGYNYATTDIATIDFREQEWNADTILYVVDQRQSLHFNQLFDIAKRRGCQADLVHVAFGTILGADGTPLKTRSGDLPQLTDVLNDAVTVARKNVEERSRIESNEEKDKLAELIGISAVKFTELSHHRLSDYSFSLEKMVAMEGDTAPYLQYSYVRIRSIFRKLETTPDLSGSLTLTEPAEIHLARMAVRFGEIVPTLLDDYRPNLLANYLLELARAFHSYFEACPVLKSEGDVQKSRLALCELTGQILEKGLGLFGISVPEQM